MRRLTVTLAFCLAPLVVFGGPPMANLAPGQLRLAETMLERGKQALAEGDYAGARRFAAQAGLDARLAYRMTDSAFIRQDAIAVHEQSARLRWLASVPAAASR